MRKKVIFYISGCSRSGSTVFEKQLASETSALSCGELRWLPERGYLKNETCGCAERFSDCIFWRKYREVHEELGCSIHELNENRKYFDGLRGFVPLIIPALRTSFWRANFNSYSKYIECLYMYLLEQDNLVLIDTSKRPFYYLLLRHILQRNIKNSNLQLRFLHFHRCAYGVVNSWRKVKLRSELYWKEEFMPIKGLFRGSLYWTCYIIVCETIRVLTGGLRVSYEDFCDDPDRTVFNVLSRYSTHDLYLSEVADEQYHPVSGNPSRFGSSEIIEDKSYQTELSFLEKAMVFLVTLPGYLFLKVSSSREAN